MAPRRPRRAAPRLTEADVKRTVGRLRTPLWLDGWWIDVETGRSESGASASCAASPEYTQATLKFDLEQVSRENLLGYVIHELMHCHVWPLAHLATQLADGNKVQLEMIRVEEERLTTTLEKILTPLLRKT